MFLNRWKRDAVPRVHQYDAPTAGIFDEPAVCIPPLNEKWIAYLTGVIGVLETAQYWTLDTSDHAETQIGILLYALQTGALCTTTDTTYEMNADKTCFRIVTNGIPGDWICPEIASLGTNNDEDFLDDSEEDEMANCNCSNGSVRVCEGRLEYKDDNGVWQPVSSEVLEGAAAPVPAPNEVPTINNACWKAHGAWAALELTGDLLASVIAASSSNVGAYNGFQQGSAGIDADNAQLMDGIQYTLADGAEILAAWAAQKIDLKNDFICGILSQFSNSTVLTDAEVQKIRDYSWGATGALNTFLEQLDDIPESRWLKVLARNYAIAQSGNCSCGGLGTPPPPEAPGDWVESFQFTNSYDAWASIMDEVNATPMEDPTLTTEGLVANTHIHTSLGVVRRAIWMYLNTPNADETSRIKRAVINFQNVEADPLGIPPLPLDQRLVNFRVHANESGEGVMVGSPSRAFAVGAGIQVIEEFTDLYALANGSFAVRVQFAQKNPYSGYTLDVDGAGTITNLIISGDGQNPFQ